MNTAPPEDEPIDESKGFEIVRPKKNQTFTWGPRQPKSVNLVIAEKGFDEEDEDYMIDLYGLMHSDD